MATDQSLAEGDLIQLQTVLRVETKESRAVEWDRHLQVARALRDLLVMSGWHDETTQCSRCITLTTLRSTQTADCCPGGESWHRVTRPRQPAQLNATHLITYGDLGVEDFASGFGLRDRFQRAVDPIVSSIRLRNVTAVTLLAQTGPGVEALGYELFLRDGMSKRKAKDVSLAHRLERILKDVADVLPFDGPEWARHLAETYNGIKHANRKLPDELDVLKSSNGPSSSFALGVPYSSVCPEKHCELVYVPILSLMRGSGTKRTRPPCARCLAHDGSDAHQMPSGRTDVAMSRRSAS